MQGAERTRPGRDIVALRGNGIGLRVVPFVKKDSSPRAAYAVARILSSAIFASSARMRPNSAFARSDSGT